MGEKKTQMRPTIEEIRRAKAWYINLLKLSSRPLEVSAIANNKKYGAKRKTNSFLKTPLPVFSNIDKNGLDINNIVLKTANTTCIINPAENIFDALVLLSKLASYTIFTRESLIGLI
ncbi:hypothetical protein [Arcticibacter sp. MXS-1]|uniref:hypothetical protein n=1 Tax=Arcticibacter sp. MXS-1 TaxID=3341726 RepID=UPI0035A8A71E